MNLVAKTAVKSVILGLTVLAIGFGIKGALAAMKRDPDLAQLPEDVIRVNVTTLESESVEITIPGFGMAKALDVVAIAPEIAGTVVEIHPNLDVGGIIAKGESIFVIDPSSYAARRDEASAHVDQLDSQLARLKTQYTIDQKRLETLKRSRALAKTEFDRRKTLLEGDDVGSQSSVDVQEQAYNAAIDIADQLAQAVEVYPMRIAEAEALLASARARHTLAEIDLKRTQLVAPFTGRVTANSVEIGQFISPGRELVTLANDAILEISIPLNVREARDWIRYTGEPEHPDRAWFFKVEPVECEVRWTDQITHDQCWTGTLHRVGMYDQESRQIEVVVRVDGKDAAPTESNGLPLVNGMFCNVKIPGRTAEDVYRVPDGLVSHENVIYMAINGRLRSVPVEVVHRDGDEILIRGEFEPGALLVTTRLTNPLENILLDVIHDEEDQTE
jgi:multidrug efflux pump subunit AcrA (membrane-fusion protein)